MSLLGHPSAAPRRGAHATLYGAWASTEMRSPPHVAAVLVLCRRPARMHATEGWEVEPHGAPGTGSAEEPRLCFGELALAELPTGFAAAIVHCTHLDLGRNRLRQLPADLGTALPALKALHLDGNRLRALPTLALPALLQLSLHDNALETIHGLEGCRRLQELRLDRNAELTALPQLPPSLTVLHLEGCASLQSRSELARALGHLSRLEDLQFPWTDADGHVQHEVGREGVRRAIKLL